MSGYNEIALLQYEIEKLRAELAEKDAEVEKLKRLNASYSSLTKAQEGQLTALRNRLYELRGADKTLDSEREANAILTEQLAALKTENATAWAQAHRLALELECLLLDTKDNAIVSKWWGPGMEALNEYQQLKPGAKEEAEAWAKMRKAGL